MTCSYISGEIRARSTTGIANVVELFKRNEPLFGVSRSVSQPRLLKGERDESPRDEDFDVGQGRISER